MKVTKVDKPKTTSVTFKTKTESAVRAGVSKWWKSGSQSEMKDALLATFSFLKENQNDRTRSAALYARMYGNMPLLGFVGSNLTKLNATNNLPVDRPTFNVVQSCIDTLIAKITQNRPSPVFLTDNSDYKQRNLAKKLNNFILGELYQTKAYDKATISFRDSLVMGDGILHVYETPDNRVGLERVMPIELFVDPNEAAYGEPRQLYRAKLIDREVLKEITEGKSGVVERADAAYLDASSDSAKTVSDLVMVVEGWHLPSAPGAKDGKHIIACSSGILLEETYTKDKFPFVFLHYSPRLLGFWSQGLAEQLMGTQMEINSILLTISRSMRLVGVPRIYVEEGSKVASAAFNNDVGSIIKYQGTKPIFEVAQCATPELYEQLQRLINFAYQQCGVSSLDASAQKPAGLNSGEAIRSYDDISTDRMATIARRYDNFFIELSYQIIDLAKDIAERDGSYQTVYPGKDGTKQVDLPKADLLDDPFVIQCFNQSSLPRDPAGRFQKVTEMVQSGMISLKEGRRLLDFPDLSQIEKLANAGEERIFQILDEIVENGGEEDFEFTPPDPFIDLQLATELTTQYINLYGAAKLEEDKMQLLRDFFTQCQGLVQQAMTPPPGAMPPGGGPPQGPPGAQPQANPEPTPTSPLIPNTPGQMAT